MLNSVAPFFIVDDLGATLAFYQSKLAFDVLYKCGGDENGADYFAIMGRDRVMLMFKAITPEVHPQPNHSRHEWARWDAFIGTDDPNSRYTEFEAGRFRSIGNWPILAMDSGRSRSPITADMCSVLGAPLTSSSGVVRS